MGGDPSVLSGLMTGVGNLKNRAFGVDIAKARDGHRRVIMFANNPACRWQNHGKLNMILNAIVS